MYLTAHKVKNREGHIGINSFRYETVEQSKSAMDRTLTDKVISIPPGGNTVLGYLDISTDDPIPVPAAVKKALAEFSEILKDEDLPIKREIDGISIVFCASFGMIGQKLELLKDLTSHIVSLINPVDNTHPKRL